MHNNRKIKNTKNLQNKNFKKIKLIYVKTDKNMQNM